VLVNRSFASLYLNSLAPLGNVLTQTAGAQAAPGRIIGMVGDAREEGLNEQPAPVVYWCYSAPTPFPNFLIRTQGDPQQMAEAVRRRIHEISPARSVYAVMPLQEHLDDAFLQSRLRTALMTFFALTAVSLASIGIYGTLSYLARMRRREFVLRIALGAPRGGIITRFLFQGMRVAALGCLAGLLVAVGLTRFLSGMLYGISPIDPATYISVIAIVLLVAALASLLPSLQVAWSEPSSVLRED